MKHDSVGIVNTEIINLDLPEAGFELEKGGVLPELKVAYECYGDCSEERDNVILICHALSGDAHAAGLHSKKDSKPGWWDIMIGPGKGIDTNRFHVICSNMLGGCRGTTGPGSINPETGKPYGSDFPEITIGDMVRVQKLLLEQLGIIKLYGVIGGSAGGLQVLDWCVRFPDMVDRAVCIAAAESLSAQALSFDIIARKAIMADPSWNNGHYYGNRGPEKGLSLARMVGHITYLSKDSMDSKFGRERREGMEKTVFDTDFQVESYLNHQGESFIRRFDANSFLYITAAMNSFSLSEYGDALEDVFRKTKSKFLILSVSSDWLYPQEQSLELAESILRAGKNVTYCSLKAPYGHDSFLKESEDLSDIISSYLTGSVSEEYNIPDKNIEEEYTVISDFIDKSGTVLDLGCGDGAFLQKMLHERGLAGHGIDIDFRNVVRCSRKGIPAFQTDLDKGLGMIPDNFYDYAVLSRTLLEVHRPHIVIMEILRVARMGIISFANFGSLKHRMRLGLKGRLPVSSALPHTWYDTPNIHYLTLKDFKQFCRENDIDIIDILCIADGIEGKIFKKLGMCNIGADRIVVKIAKKGTVPEHEHSSDRCTKV